MILITYLIGLIIVSFMYLVLLVKTWDNERLSIYEKDMYSFNLWLMLITFNVICLIVYFINMK